MKWVTLNRDDLTGVRAFTVKTISVLGNAIPVLGMKLKRGSAYFGNFST